MKLAHETTMALKEIGNEVTQLDLSLPPFILSFYVRNNRSLGLRTMASCHTRNKKTRRMIVLMIFKQLRPLFSNLRGLSIKHHNGRPWHVIGPKRLIDEEIAPNLSNQQEQLGFRIRIKRLELGFTQGQFAARVGLNRSQMSKIENGLCKMRRSTWMKIKKVIESLDKPKATKTTSVEATHASTLYRPLI